MTTLKFILIFLSLALYSCEQNTKKRKIDSSVTILSNKIIQLVNHLDNPDSCKKALLFLDSATAIDSNCFSCYYKKLMFFSSLKQYDKAFLTINNCIRISPNAHDLYLTGGMLSEQIGDTASSCNYFKKSLTICNAVLDTMNVKNRHYSMFTTNKAINLIMLDDSINANNVLKDLYKILPDEPAFDNIEKKYVQTLMNKSKRQLLDSINNPYKYNR